MFKKKYIFALISITFLLNVNITLAAPNKVHPLFNDDPVEDKGVVSEAVSGVAKKLSETLNAAKLPGGYAQLAFNNWKEGNSKAKYELYSMAADGDDNARTILGYMYDNGVGFKKNRQSAFDLFLTAAPSVDLARYNLAVMYMYGRGTNKNVDKAMEWYARVDKISAAKVQMAEYALTKKKGNAATLLAEQATKAKNVDGTYLYGRLLLEKGEANKGSSYIRKAAGFGHPQAIKSMIVLYERGLGLSADEGLAKGWWVIDRVYTHGDNLEDTIKSLEKFNLNPGDKRKAARYARRWLLNRSPYEPFDYKKTKSFDFIKR